MNTPLILDPPPAMAQIPTPRHRLRRHRLRGQRRLQGHCRLSGTNQGRRHQRDHGIQTGGGPGRFAAEQERLPGLLPDGAAGHHSAGRNPLQQGQGRGRREIVARPSSAARWWTGCSTWTRRPRSIARASTTFPSTSASSGLCLKECGTIDPEASRIHPPRRLCGGPQRRS
jgi:hypothetical protein